MNYISMVETDFTYPDEIEGKTTARQGTTQKAFKDQNLNDLIDEIKLYIDELDKDKNTDCYKFNILIFKKNK